MNIIQQIQKDLKALSSPEKAKASSWFFKTGPGQYGEGDKFYGVTVPETRSVGKKYYKEITLEEIQELLNSPIHEERSISLYMLVDKFKYEKENRKKYYDFYLSNAKKVNNWDLVDSSAEFIVGKFLLENDMDISVLKKLAHSDNLWERRISIISTFDFIKNQKPEPTIQIAKLLINDKHDLIQKAVGWMLREIGKKCSKEILRDFLKEYSKTMPRTMLRYAIEHFDKIERAKWMSKN